MRPPPADPPRPMLAQPGPVPTRADRYAFEFKWDGVRAIVDLARDPMRVLTRNARNVTSTFPELSALREQVAGPAWLDGEIIAPDAQGRPDFARLQRRMHVEDPTTTRRLAREVPVRFIAFDLLREGDNLLLDVPYTARRRRLEAIGLDGAVAATPPAWPGDGEATFAASRALGLEGVVGKRLDSPYRPGIRSADWIKTRHTRRQEFVVAGWVPGRGARAGTVGGLLLAVRDPDEDGFRYVGRVGSGFTDADLDEWRQRLAPIVRPDAAFVPDVAAPHDARHVDPRFVVEVEFHDWTPAGHLRHPVYRGLRTDKDARQVVREPLPGGP